MSSAVSGLVGAIAPVIVAFLSRRASGIYIRLAPVFCPYSSAQHIPRRQRSPLLVVYATSETAPELSVVTSVTRPTRDGADLAPPCVGLTCSYPDSGVLMHSS